MGWLIKDLVVWVLAGRKQLLTKVSSCFDAHSNYSRVLLISNFRHVLYVVCFLLGNSPASEFYMPTFRNTLSVPSSQASKCIHTYLAMKMEQCSEMSAYKIQTSGNYPEENIQYSWVLATCTLRVKPPMHQGIKLTPHLHLQPRSRMPVVIHPLSRKPSGNGT